jgi:DNA-binding transcriptional LysR family regulator
MNQENRYNLICHFNFIEYSMRSADRPRVAARPRFSLRQLEAFRALAATGSVARAAAELGRTQSAVSMALQDLQLALGVALVQRSGRGLVLTATGERLLPRADELLSRADDLQREGGASADAAAGSRLAIGATRSIGPSLLPPLVADFRGATGHRRFELAVGNTEEVLARVASYELDAAFVEGEVLDPAFERELWMKDELVVFVRPGHPLLQRPGAGAPRRGVAPDELARWPWALRERNSGTREAVLRAASAMGRLEVGVEATDVEALKRLVALDDWIGCLSRRVLASELRNGTLAELPLASAAMRRALVREFLLVLNPARYRGAAALRFIEFARHWGRSHRTAPRGQAGARRVRGGANAA